MKATRAASVEEGGLVDRGPVSPRSRRLRRWARWGVGTFSTVALASVVSVVVLMCADVLGPMGPMLVSLGLLMSVVVLYSLAGITPFTVALACALVVVAASHWLGLYALNELDAVFERIAS